jgi:hypothetical protein
MNNRLRSNAKTRYELLIVVLAALVGFAAEAHHSPARVRA